MDLYSNALRSLRFQLREIDGFLSQCGSSTMYSSPSIFIEALLEDVSDVKEELDLIHGMAFDGSYNQKQIYNQISVLQQSVALISNRTNFVRNSRLDTIPWSAIEMIKSLKDAIAPEEELIVSSCTLATYRIWKPNKNDYSQKSDSIAVLEVPFIYKTNSFLHILVAHEIFHLQADKFVSSKREKCLRNIRQKWDEFFASQPPVEKAQKDVSNQQQLLADVEKTEELKERSSSIEAIKNRTVEIFESTVKEIFCDVGCLAIFGPATLFALNELHQLNSDSHDDIFSEHYHPPFHSRMKALMSVLSDDKNYLNALNILKQDMANDFSLEFELYCFNDAISELQKEVATIKTVNSDAIQSRIKLIVKEESDTCMLDAVKHISNIIGDNKISWLNSPREVSNHVKNLKKFSPSGFVKNDKFSLDPSSHGSLGLAAWINNIARSKRIDSRVDIDTFLSDCNMLLKSWDDSETIKGFMKNGTYKSSD